MCRKGDDDLEAPLARLCQGIVQADKHALAVDARRGLQLGFVVHAVAPGAHKGHAVGDRLVHHGTQQGGGGGVGWEGSAEQVGDGGTALHHLPLVEAHRFLWWYITRW